jgi:hypothetical protein
MVSGYECLCPCRFLEKSEYESSVVDNGKSALEALRAPGDTILRHA